MPTTYTYIKGQTDLSAAGTYVNGVPPNGDNQAALVFADGGQPGSAWQHVDALKGVRFATITSGPGFGADLGDSSGFVEFDCDHDANSTIDWQGQGSAFLKGGTNAAFSKLIWRPVNPTAQLNLMSVAVAALEVQNGFALVPSTVTLGSLNIRGTSQVEVREHSTDTISGGRLVGRSQLRVSRLIAGAFLVGPGCTLIVDVDDATLSGVITIAGGRVVVLRGSVSIVGESGELDYSGLQKSGYTLTITEGKDLTEVKGPVAFTTVNRTTVGDESNKITKR